MNQAIDAPHAVEAVPRDPLTGLPARRAFDAAVARAVEQAQAAGEAVSLAVVDIDLFGGINASRGRAAGDAVLHALGAWLAAEANAGGRVYRYGGDAFAVLWAGLDKERAFLGAESLRQRLEGAALDGAGPVTVSVGLAARPDDAESESGLVQRANEALYRAKVSGRNRVCLAREEKMLTKTSHYTQGQLLGLRRLAEREGIKDAELLREALNDLLRKYNA